MRPLTRKIVAKKSLGQHFLINAGIQQKITDSCELSNEDTVVEIGPGKGAITKLLAPRVKKLIAIEKDHALAGILSEEMKGLLHVEVRRADILHHPLNGYGPIKIVGNLPYNIATPIIEKVIRERACCRGFYFMVQKEYADRLVAPAGSRTYGSLSCFVQYYAAIKLLFRIKPGSFRPSPKVDSAFCRMLFHGRPPYPAVDEEALFALIRTAFSQRRKTLENALASVVQKEMWGALKEKVGIEPRWRPEEVTLKHYVGLSNELKRITSASDRPSR